ncbi:hypothetical protein VSWAT3_10616 [Vibrionales bacterium SWAT-3]|nr:hypothetical protein VSWAT3_10616 [Vibrionales bacterium SWAT-3]
MLKLENSKLLSLVDSRFHPYLQGDDLPCSYLDVKRIDYTKRVDILVKIKLLESYDSGCLDLLEYYKELYLETIYLFTDGSFVEPGDSNKKSKNDYVSSFISLYENIREQGFNFSDGVIPISNGVPLDGAHRVAIAYVLNIELPVVEIDIKPVNYGIEYFSERDAKNHIQSPLIDILTDFFDDIRIAIIWPKAKLGFSDVKSLFGESYVFSKSLNLNENGLNNLCVSAYKDESWAGDLRNNWDGSWAKSSLCYSNDATSVVLFRPLYKGQDLEIKNALREKNFGSKHCIHSTDFKYDTQNLSKCTFSKNSEQYLNNIQLSKFSALKKEIEVEGLCGDIIVGSSFMAVLGIRKNNDIDTLNLQGSGSHNDYISYYSSAVNILRFKSIYRFLDVDFLDLDEIRIFKNNRCEKKDIDDIKLIDLFFKGNSKSLTSKLLVKKREVTQSFQRKRRRTILVLVDILKKVGLFHTVRNIYHSFR